MTNPPTTQQHEVGGATPQTQTHDEALILTAEEMVRVKEAKPKDGPPRPPKYEPSRATKIHRRNNQGGWTSAGYSIGAWFSAQPVQFSSLKEMLPALRQAGRNHRSFLVADVMREDADPAKLRRAVNNEEWGVAGLATHHVGHRWICWEVDKVKHLPEWFDPAGKDRSKDTAFARWWIERNLPAGFRGRSAILQWSSSALFQGKVAMHLWQWMDRPVSRDCLHIYWRAAKRAAQAAGGDVPMDITIWDSARVHYIADPRFEAPDGSPLEDPLAGWRWQWVEGECGDVCEALPEWVDQPAWDVQEAEAKAHAEKMRAEFAANKSERASAGGAAAPLVGEETGRLEPVSMLHLQDLDPKRVLAWARAVAEGCEGRISRSGEGDRHLTARGCGLFMGNVLAGLEAMGAALSAETQSRVGWSSEVAGVEAAVAAMEQAAVVVGDGDADRARVVRWAVEMGRAEPCLPDYRLAEKYRESAKKGAKVIHMKPKGKASGGGKVVSLPSYEDQPAVEMDVEGDEDGEVEMTPEQLADAEAQAARRAWTSLLKRNKETGALTKSHQNFVTLAMNDPDFGQIRFNEVAARLELWGTPAWVDGEITQGTPLTDAHVGELRLWLAESWEYFIGKDATWDLICVVAARNAYDPLKDYLRGLKWDGVPRIFQFAHTHLKADDTEAAQKAGGWWLMAATRRALEPGCQSDYVLTLEGRQGLGKSQLLKRLSPSREHMMIFQGDPASPKAIESIRGKWLIELAELSVLGRGRDMRIVKGFITTEADDYRAPWARAPSQYPRRCAFLATVNPEGEGGYLADATGNRRWWPIHVREQIDLDAVERDRDQLWAEAVARLGTGERHWPTPEEEARLFAPEQKKREEEDAWTDTVFDFARVHGKVTTLGVLMDALKFPEDKCDRHSQNRVGGILQRLGWTPRKGIRANEMLDGKPILKGVGRLDNKRWWQPPPEFAEDSERCPF